MLLHAATNASANRHQEANANAEKTSFLPKRFFQYSPLLYILERHVLCGCVRLQRSDMVTTTPTLRLQSTTTSAPPPPPPVVGDLLKSSWLDKVEYLHSRLMPTTLQNSAGKRSLTAWDRLQLLKVLCDELCTSSALREALTARANRKQELVSELQEDVMRIRQMPEVSMCCYALCRVVHPNYN